MIITTELDNPGLPARPRLVMTADCQSGTDYLEIWLTLHAVSLGYPLLQK